MMSDFKKDLGEAKAFLYDHAAGNPELYKAIGIIEEALEKGDQTGGDKE